MASRTPGPRPPVKRPRTGAPAAQGKSGAAAAKDSKAAADAKADKPAKVKLVRDSFTIPKTEYAALDELKRRAARAGLPSKKSELLRAGLMALAAMADAPFRAAMEGVPRLKTGRPTKG